MNYSMIFCKLMRYDRSSVKGVDRCSYTMMDLLIPPKTIFMHDGRMNYQYLFVD